MGFFIIMGIVIIGVYFLFKMGKSKDLSEEEIGKLAEEKLQYMLKRKKQGYDVKEEISNELKVIRDNAGCVQEINSRIFNDKNKTAGDMRYHHQNHMEIKDMIVELQILNYIYKRV